MSPSANGLSFGSASTLASYDRTSSSMTLPTPSSSLPPALPSAVTGCAARFAPTSAVRASTSGVAVTYYVTVSRPCSSREVPTSAMWPSCSDTPASKRRSATPGSASSDSERSTLVAIQLPALMWPWLRSCVRCFRRVLEGLSFLGRQIGPPFLACYRHGCPGYFVQGSQEMAELQRRRGGLIPRLRHFAVTMFASTGARSTSSQSPRTWSRSPTRHQEIAHVARTTTLKRKETRERSSI